MAIDTTTLTTAKVVKQNSFIEENVQDSIVTIAMRRVQDMHIEPILGTALYTKILAGVKADDLIAPYTTLLDKYILPTYFAYCEYEVAPHVNTEIRNKAVGKGLDGDISAATETELNYVRASYLKAAKKYEARLIGHLKDACSDDTYPEYKDNSGHEQMKPKQRIYGRSSYINGLRPEYINSRENHE
jgi:hypothetical protein